MVRSRLLRHLGSGQPAAYLYDLVADYPLRPSKMLRSVLCLATCRLYGGRESDALDAAVAIELLHSAFMVHDDIEDDSEVRRGRPTLHRAHGVALAINAGDALGFMSLVPLLGGAPQRPHAVTWAMITEMLDVVLRTIEGQALELGWIRDGIVDLQDGDYMAMVAKKTCWYTTILPCRLGELAATGRLAGSWPIPFGTCLGTAFQIRDDVLNIEGTLEAYGKEIGGDIREGKRTLILLHLLRNCDRQDRERVVAIYRRPREARTAEEVLWVAEAMREAGSLEYATSAANGLAGAALAELEPVLAGCPASDDTRFLRGVVVELVTRDR
jgi:geranylgeranyl diphosphate synthase type II